MQYIAVDHAKGDDITCEIKFHFDRAMNIVIDDIRYIQPKPLLEDRTK